MQTEIIKALMGAAGSGDKTYLDDVFHTEVYQSTDQNADYKVTNNIDNSGEGAMLWYKDRNGTGWHVLWDTERGSNKYIYSNSDSGESTSELLKSFDSDGYTIKGGTTLVGTSRKNVVWNFRKAPGFFDVVTWTGNGTSGRSIAHDLGSIPGMIIVKRTDDADDWYTANMREDHAQYIFCKLNEPDAAFSNDLIANVADANNIIVDGTSNGGTGSFANLSGGAHTINTTGETYVAYVFADGSSKETTSRSVYFDGSSDYLLSTSSDYSPGTGDFTMEAWVNLESGVAATDGIFQLSSTSGAFTYGGIALLYKKSNSENRWELYGGNSTNQSESATFTGYEYGKWVHTAIVKTSGNIKLYINGEERISAADTQNYSGYQYLGLGAAFGSTYNFKGNISNFKLTIGQALYTSAFTPTNVPLTTTSQSSTASNVKILCCNNSSVTGKTVGATITSNGTVTASGANPDFIDTEANIFGADEDQEIIQCGSYVGNGSATGPEINLGWEPQLVLIKNTSASATWDIFDSMRGITADRYWQLTPNTSNQEYSDAYAFIRLTPTGFQVTNAESHVNANGNTYIYMCIRRPDGYVGKTAKVGTDAFNVANYDSTKPAFNANFPVDFALFRRTTSAYDWRVVARLIARKYMPIDTGGTSNENDYEFDFNNGWNKQTGYANTEVSWMWARGKGFDVVDYKGNGTAVRRISHSMNQTVEMIWTKNRSSTTGWRVWHKGLNGGGSNAATWYLSLNASTAQTSNGDIYGSSSGVLPTSTEWTVGSNAAVNENGSNHTAMLFSSVSGISKCGFYDGNENAQTITVGFQPRLIIIKRITSGAGGDDWVVADTLRGIGAGSNDKILYFNVSDAQSTQSLLDITSTGFTVVADYHEVNHEDHKYIYYCHA